MQELNELILWLEEVNKKIKALEEEAEEIVSSSGNAYTDFMRQKAKLLASIAKDAAPLLKNVEGKARSTVEDRLASFSSGAQNALNLDSGFYMSALLHSSKSSKGDPNNLERLIDELKSSS